MAGLGKRPAMAMAGGTCNCKRSRPGTKATAGVQNTRPLRVCGPEFVQTLRGHLIGRQVALICCGEAHERALDLTREQGILEPVRGWLEVQRSKAPGFHPKDACKSKCRVTLEEAKQWAWEIMEYDRGESDDDGVVLMYQPSLRGSTFGVAHYFSAEHYFKHGRDKRGEIPANAAMYKWYDKDTDAHANKERLLAEKDLNVTMHDAVIAKRKDQRRGEGLELFDDWLVRRYKENTTKKSIRVDYVYEGPVPLSQVELHVEPGVPKLPPAHECMKAIELDSDVEDDEEWRDIDDDGECAFADYLTRRIKDKFRSRHVHGIDLRTMGDPEEQSEKDYLKTIAKRFPKDAEELELERAGAKYPKWYTDTYVIPGRTPIESLPSWECFFGGQTAELLYYSAGVKADYAPLMATCLPTPARLSDFFTELYFGTVPTAISHLGPMDDNARSLTYIRSRAHRPAPHKALTRRPDDDHIVPVKFAPIDKYLKARGSNPPRTWVSGLAATVRAGGGEEVVNSVQSWYKRSVSKLLANPKDGDSSGDYFISHLREAYPEIYKQIDPSDPEEVRKATYVQGLDQPGFKRRHHVGKIRNPSLTQALAELRQFNSADLAATSKRQRVLAKIIVDAFHLRLVDVAAILKVAAIAASAPVGSRLVIVFYGGSDHTKSLSTFFKSQGFSSEGLPSGGMVDGRSRQPGESSGLKYPAFLHDFELLFPVP